MGTKKLRMFILCLIVFLVWAGSACAMNLDRVKEHFLKSEWKDGIREGEAQLAGAGRDSAGLDQLYYYLGMCYFKEGQFLRSADIFEIILKEFPKSALAEPALRASIESYGSKGDYETAVSRSQAFLKKYPQSPSANEVARQLLLNMRKTDKQGTAFVPEPAQPSSEQDPDIVLAADLMQGRGKVDIKQSFWIQVGAFSSDRNARNLAAKLRAVSYTAAVAQSLSKGKSIFKVRVGPYRTREEAQAASKKLSREGYPTKVIP